MVPGAPTVLAGRYELLELLGSGGMADVHRAHDRVLDRLVAVKLLRESADTDADRRRFDGEARLLAHLAHPGLVRLLDAGTDAADQPFLVMELVEGPTLGAALDQGLDGEGLDGEGPAETRLALAGSQVAAALAHAHDHGIVHRDVKPANILLDRTGQAKLADFGIARVVGENLRHTRTGQAIGTAAYLAPEQVRGEAVSSAADVYALGLVLLEALTGRRAYPGTTIESAFARLHHSPEIPLSLPPGWPRLLAAMTALDPLDRPSAHEVAADLAALADPDGRPVWAGPVTEPVPLMTTGGRVAGGRRTVMPMAGCGLAVALVVALVLLFGGGPTGQPPAEAEVVVQPDAPAERDDVRRERRPAETSPGARSTTAVTPRTSEASSPPTDGRKARRAAPAGTSSVAPSAGASAGTSTKASTKTSTGPSTTTAPPSPPPSAPSPAGDEAADADDKPGQRVQTGKEKRDDGGPGGAKGKDWKADVEDDH